MSYSPHVLLACGFDFGVVFIAAADVGDMEAYEPEQKGWGY